MNKIQNLPNRKERRKMAKDLGLFGKKKNKAETSESKERTKAVGNLIRLRNLTEQRNNNKTKD
jgi:hypothetical protein